MSIHSVPKENQWYTWYLRCILMKGWCLRFQVKVDECEQIGIPAKFNGGECHVERSEKFIRWLTSWTGSSRVALTWCHIRSGNHSNSWAQRFDFPKFLYLMVQDNVPCPHLGSSCTCLWCRTISDTECHWNNGAVLNIEVYGGRSFDFCSFNKLFCAKKYDQLYWIWETSLLGELSPGFTCSSIGTCEKFGKLTSRKHAWCWREATRGKVVPREQHDNCADWRPIDIPLDCFSLCFLHDWQGTIIHGRERSTTGTTWDTVREVRLLVRAFQKSPRSPRAPRFKLILSVHCLWAFSLSWWGDRTHGHKAKNNL